ncbi:MAG: alpha/beta hydrolase [Ilumatobacteraceae bacterium]
MATFVLIPGAGSDAWFWHLVEPELRVAGHDVVAVELPCEDDAAGLAEYTDAVVAAIADRAGRDDLVVVGHSMGALTAPLVCARVSVALLVLVAAMTPQPGETGAEWGANTGSGEARQRAADAGGWSVDDEVALYLHDVPADVVAASEAHQLGQSGRPFEDPWPLAAWPDVPTRFLLCRDDRCFPADLQRRVARERLGIVPDEMEGGHLPPLAHPEELSRRLLAYAAEVTGSPEARSR